MLNFPPVCTVVLLFDILPTFLQVGVESEDKPSKPRKHEDKKTVNQGQAGFVRAVRDTQSIEEEVMLATGCVVCRQVVYVMCALVQSTVNPYQ